MKDRPTERHLQGWIRAVADEKDRAAFGMLFEHFAPRLKAYIRRGGTSEDAAEELAQEAMIQVWHKAGSFDPSRAGVSTWIFTIARNKRIDRLRREGRPQIDEAEYRAHFANQQDVFEAAHAEQTRDRLGDLVDELPNDQREVIQLAYFEDKTHTAIADELRLPLGTVKSRIRLALDKLRQTVTDEAP